MAQEEVGALDLMNQLAGLAADSPLAGVRALRPEVVRHTQGSYEKLFAPADTADLTAVERAQVALRVAALNATPTLLAHYRQLLAALGVTPEQVALLEQRDRSVTLDPRTTAIMRHVDLVTRTPGAATPADLAALQASGLSVTAIVTLSQLIAFLSFQVRTLTVLTVLAEEA
ncbi:MAG: CMD domain protein [Caldilinea sp. CFX5]|nr:CMD domain protein [Caldilinea sp. CFX5]